MERIKGLAIELDLDHLAVDRGLKGLKDNLRTVNSEMRANMSAFDRSDRSVQKYQTRLEGLNKKLEVQKRVVDEAKKEYEEMVNEHGRGSKEAEKAAREYNNQAAALNNLERYIERTKGELQKLEREQRIANSGWTKFGNKLEETSDRLKSASDRMGRVGSTLTNKITKPAVGAATALASLTIYKGFQRLVGIDTAQAQLKALGHDAKEVEQIMDAALISVRGTSHGMDEAATTAASAVAAGVDPVKDLERYLSLAADTASVANVPFAEMGTIFNKVQTTGKAQNDVLQQLSERGIPIYQYLADTISKSTEEIEKMARDGKIKTKDFLKAVEDNIGGAAQVIGEESFAAAWKNIGADISRIGANFLDSGDKGKGFFSTIKPMLVDFRGWLADAEDKAADLGVKFGQSFQKMVDKAKELKKRYDELTPAQQDFVRKVLLLGPAVAVGIGPAITLFSKLTLGISGVLKVTGRLSKAIGVARGSGLAAGLASLGPGAVAGVAVAGLVAVGATINHLRTKADEAYTSQLKLAEGNLQAAKARTEEAKQITEQIDKTTELIAQTKEQMETTDELVTTFENLTEKSKLTRDEFGEFLTLQTQLEHTKSPQRIAEMEERMEELRKKSGLSKDEFQRMLEVNADLAEMFPEAGKVIDDYGNIIMDTTGKLGEMTQAELERKQLEIYNEMIDGLRTVNSEIDGYHDLLGEITELEDSILQRKEEVKQIQNDIKANEDEIRQKNEKLLEVKEQMKDASFLEWLELDKQRGTLELQIGKLEEINTKYQNNLEVVEDTLSTEEKQLNENEKLRDVISEQIDKNNANYEAYRKILEQQYDINIEIGKENESIDAGIKKRQEAIKKLEEKIKKEGDSNGELQKSIDHLKNENSQLDDLKKSLGNINSSLETQNEKYTDAEDKLKKVNQKFEAAGGLIDSNIKKSEIMNDMLDKDHTKNITATDNGTIAKIDRMASAPKNKTINLEEKGLASINKEASKPVTKKVTLSALWTGVQSGLKAAMRNFRIPGFATGTPPSGHKGGPAIVGEKGSELIKLPSGRMLLSPNTHTLFPNMPKGTHVIPNRETKRIMKNVPRYANGTRDWANALGNSEFARLLNSYSNESNVVVSRDSNDSGNNKIVSLLIEQNNLLMQLLNKDINPIIDDRSLGKGLEPIITEIQNRKQKVRDTFAQI